MFNEVEVLSLQYTKVVNKYIFGVTSRNFKTFQRVLILNKVHVSPSISHMRKLVRQFQKIH